MRKNNCKRAGALALATVMLAGALALPANAAADAAYIQQLDKVWAQSYENTAAYRQGLQQLMQQYPNSPEPYYLYAESIWDDTYYEDKLPTAAEYEELLSYLDTAIGLALREEHPYQSRWDFTGETTYPLEDGYEQDYATMAARLRVEVLSTMPGHQAELNDAMQQYLDCWDRGKRIELEDMKEHPYYYTEDKDDCKWTLEEEIPMERAELENIRAWTGTGATSFVVGEHSDFPENVTISADGKHIVSGSSEWFLTQPVQSVQRTLGGFVAFVPAGTGVQSSNEFTGLDSTVHTLQKGECYGSLIGV